MHIIQLTAELSDDLKLKSVTIDINTTELKNDSELVRQISWTILKSLVANKEDIQIQDMLNDLNIKRDGAPTTNE